MSRICLTENVLRYLDAVNGNDANDGLTPATAWKSREHAYNVFRRGYDLCGYKVRVQVIGDIIGGCTLSGRLVGQEAPADFQFYGSANAWNAPGPNTISSTVASDVLFFVNNDAWFGLNGFQLRATGSSSFGIAVGQGNVAVENCWVGSVTGSAFDVCGPTSQIALFGFTTFLFEDSGAACTAEDHGQIYMGSQIYISGGPKFSNAFVQSDLGGCIDASGGSVALAGALKGVRYHAYSNSIIHSNGMIFPGDTPGYCDSTSSYN